MCWDYKRILLEMYNQSFGDWGMSRQICREESVVSLLKSPMLGNTTVRSYFES
jgi:hypothetical protein